jgi:hypothetical protein
MGMSVGRVKGNHGESSGQRTKVNMEDNKDYIKYLTLNYSLIEAGEPES